MRPRTDDRGRMSLHSPQASILNWKTDTPQALCGGVRALRKCGGNAEGRPDAANAMRQAEATCRSHVGSAARRRRPGASRCRARGDDSGASPAVPRSTRRTPPCRYTARSDRSRRRGPHRCGTRGSRACGRGPRAPRRTDRPTRDVCRSSESLRRERGATQVHLDAASAELLTDVAQADEPFVVRGLRNEQIERCARAGVLRVVDDLLDRVRREWSTPLDRARHPIRRQRQRRAHQRSRLHIRGSHARETTTGPAPPTIRQRSGFSLRPWWQGGRALRAGRLRGTAARRREVLALAGESVGDTRGNQGAGVVASSPERLLLRGRLDAPAGLAAAEADAHLAAHVPHVQARQHHDGGDADEGDRGQPGRPLHERAASRSAEATLPPARRPLTLPGHVGHASSVRSRPPVFVASGFVAKYPTGGGNFWVPLQYVLGLRALGVEAYWLEMLWPQGDVERTRGFVPAFRRFVEEAGVAEHTALVLFPDNERDDA